MLQGRPVEMGNNIAMEDYQAANDGYVSVTYKILVSVLHI